MGDQPTTAYRPFGHLDLRRKRESLSVPCDVVRALETELAKAKADRAALMRDLQSDLRKAAG
jgi:hypothetical protein